MKISRGQTIQASLLIGGLIWAFLIILGIESNYWSQIIYSLPSYTLILFGSYAVFTIGKDLSILKDFPGEQTSLLKEITEANDYFRKHNVLQ